MRALKIITIQKRGEKVQSRELVMLREGEIEEPKYVVNCEKKRTITAAYLKIKRSRARRRSAAVSIGETEGNEELNSPGAAATLHPAGAKGVFDLPELREERAVRDATTFLLDALSNPARAAKKFKELIAAIADVVEAAMATADDADAAEEKAAQLATHALYERKREGVLEASRSARASRESWSL